MLAITAPASLRPPYREQARSYGTPPAELELGVRTPPLAVGKISRRRIVGASLLAIAAPASLPPPHREQARSYAPPPAELELGVRTLPLAVGKISRRCIVGASLLAITAPASLRPPYREQARSYGPRLPSWSSAFVRPLLP